MFRWARAAALLIPCTALVAACGGDAPRPEMAKTPTADAGGDDGAKAADPNALASAIGKDDSKVEPFVATSGPGDSPVPFVRDERSSRLDMPAPRGASREAWRVKLDGPRRTSCRGGCSMSERSFVLAVGNRVAVVETDAWQLFDSKGNKVDAGKVESGAVRLDRASGTLVPDDVRQPADGRADTRIASHGGKVVSVGGNAVRFGERTIDGKFEAFDVAVDESLVACVLVRQGKELALWTAPLALRDGGSAIGRQKISGPARRALGPPVLGKRLRVYVLDTGLLAVSLDGKKLWERRGLLPTGGVSITADDVVLVADGGHVLAIEPRGRVDELWRDKESVFVTPPILNSQGLLLLASTDMLHAIAFAAP